MQDKHKVISDELDKYFGNGSVCLSDDNLDDFFREDSIFRSDNSGQDKERRQDKYKVIIDELDKYFENDIVSRSDNSRHEQERRQDKRKTSTQECVARTMGTNYTNTDGRKHQFCSNSSVYENTCHTNSQLKIKLCADMPKELNKSTDDLFRKDHIRNKSLSRQKSVSLEDLHVPVVLPKRVVSNTKSKKGKTPVLEKLVEKIKFNIIDTRNDCVKSEHCSPNLRTLDSKYKVLKSFEVSCRNPSAVIGSIIPLDDETCWIHFLDDKNVMRISCNGESRQHFKLENRIDDKTMDDKSNIYVTCPSINSILRIDQYSKVSIEHELRMSPHGIAYHSQLKQLLVCRNSSQVSCAPQICKNNFIIRCSITEQRSVSSVNTQDMFQCPHRVRVNRHNGDVIVSDFYQGIFVLDSYFELRFTIGPECKPSSVCTDERGRLLVSNITSQSNELCLRILSSDGTIEREVYIEKLDKHSGGISTSVVDRNGHLWLALGRRIYVIEILV